MQTNPATTKQASAWQAMAVAAALALAGCGPSGAPLVNSGGTPTPATAGSGAVHVDAGGAPASGGGLDAGSASWPGLLPGSGGSTPPATGSSDAGGAGSSSPAVDAGSAPVDAGSTSTSTSTSTSPGASTDAGTSSTSTSAPVDAGSSTGTGASADAGSASAPANPSFASWAWSTPDVNAVVHAGFKWFESGYPGTFSLADNQTLAAAGAVPFAYINMSEVPSDTYLQSQIGSFWSSIALCTNTSWSSTVVDVRDSRWQDWLVRRANDAYALGNRGIKWDVAGVETLCNNWSSAGGSTAAQQAVDAMASVLSTLKSQHPDFKFIVNQGFGLAEQHPELVDGFELENMMNYYDQNPSDTWTNEYLARVGSIHTNNKIPVFALEYYDVFGCSDTSCAYADQLYNQIVALDWVPYITAVHMNVQGRGLGITPPW